MAAKPTLTGLTTTDCCKACSADGCVISGENYCAHPRKGGLQGAGMQDREAISRLNAAQKSIAGLTATDRFK
jgi:hypothetical protein